MGRRVAFARIGALGALLVLLAVGCSANLTVGLREKIAAEDPEAPLLPADAAISVDQELNQSLEVSWQPATDGVVAQAELEYLLVWSRTEADVTGEAALGTATVARDWTAGQTTGTVAGLTYDTDYYVGVVVRDRAGNHAYYTAAQGHTANDLLAPVPGGTITATNIGKEEVSVSWPAASDPDDLSPQAELEYRVVYTHTADISTVAAALANGTVALDWTADTATHTITSLVDAWDYDINVLVRDRVLNVQQYGVIAVTTVKHPRIFWVEGVTSKIMVMDVGDTDGSTVSPVIAGLNFPFAIALDPVERVIYWTDTSPPESVKIRKVGFDGTGAADVITSGLTEPMGLAVDPVNRALYWTDDVVDGIYKAAIPVSSTDAADHVLFGSGSVDTPMDIDVDLTNSKIWWIENGTTKLIRESGLSGGTISDHASLALVGPIALDAYPAASTIFVTDLGALSWKLYSINTTSWSVTNLINTDISAPKGVDVDVDHGRLYWTDSTEKQIYTSLLDGTSRTSLPIGGLDYPCGIAVY